MSEREEIVLKNVWWLCTKENAVQCTFVVDVAHLYNVFAVHVSY